MENNSGVYKVIGEDGKTEHIIFAPEGGSIQSSLSSGSGQAYKTNGTDTEDYLPAAEAKASVSIDPYEGTITVSGPKWLIGDVINSDSFKKNYTENKALLNAINAYRTNPDSTVVDPTSGNPIKVSDILKSYQDGANSYANAYTQIKDYKIDANKKYGVNFSDENVYTANNFHSKEDYDANGVIYILIGLRICTSGMTSNRGTKSTELLVLRTFLKRYIKRTSTIIPLATSKMGQKIGWMLCQV